MRKPLEIFFFSWIYVIIYFCTVLLCRVVSDVRRHGDILELFWITFYWILQQLTLEQVPGWPSIICDQKITKWNIKKNHNFDQSSILLEFQIFIVTFLVYHRVIQAFRSGQVGWWTKFTDENPIQNIPILLVILNLSQFKVQKFYRQKKRGKKLVVVDHFFFLVFKPSLDSSKLQV